MSSKSCNKRYRTKFIQINENNELICYICKEYKCVEEFNINKQNSNIFYREGRDKRCKYCKNLQYVKRRKNNRGKRDIDRLLLERWHGLKDRSIKKGFIVDFNWEFLKELWNKQNGLCAISNIPMTFEMNNGRVPTNVSVDRRDSKLYYTKDNIQLICMAINQMKSDLSTNELLYFCKEIIKNN